MSKGCHGDEYVPVADEIAYDPDNCDSITADNIQEAVDELCEAFEVATTPSFSWGRSGNVSANTWLLNDGVSSRRSGRTVVVNNPRITNIFSASSELDSYTLEVYEHDGDLINSNLLTTLVVSGSRTGNSGTVNITTSIGKQISIKLVSGSAKHVVTGLIMKGTIS